MNAFRGIAGRLKVASVLEIAERELGLPEGSLGANEKLENHFTDSLDWLDFITVLRIEVGPLTDEQATAAETFQDLVEAYCGV